MSGDNSKELKMKEDILIDVTMECHFIAMKYILKQMK